MRSGSRRVHTPPRPVEEEITTLGSSFIGDAVIFYAICVFYCIFISRAMYIRD